MAARPLEGVLVVSLEQAVAAPLASCRLADAGARVIKIERPEGDFARGYDRAANGTSSYFAWLNRGKQSIALDLRDPADHGLMSRMLARADVFIQNLAVGAAARLGFGHEELRAKHPGLIVCDISGYGETGPYADAKAYDLLVQAESGLISVSGAPGPLGRVGVSAVDIGTGLNAAQAITQALVGKFRTGVGAHVQVSLFDTMAEWMAVPLLHHDYLGAAPGRVGLAHPSIAPYGGFETSDRATLLISVQSDREWVTLCTDVLDRPDVAVDQELSTNNGRVAHRNTTDGIVASSFAQLSKAEAERRLRAARIAYGNVNDVAGLSRHPHLRRHTVVVKGAPIDVPATPIRNGTSAPRDVPAIDEHGEALRNEFA